MKVGFLAGTLGRGGAERQLIYMLQALINEGIEARVLCLTKDEAFEQEIRYLGVEVDWIGRSQNRLSRLGSLARNLQKNPVDILQSAHFYTNIYVAIAARILGIRSIGAIRNDLISEITANGAFGKLQVGLPHMLIANSQLAMTRAIATGIQPESINLLRNVVSERDSNFRLGRKENLQVLFAGRLVPQKRPEVFIELASQIRKTLPKHTIKFIVAGDGPLRSSVEQMANELVFSETELIFLGEQSDMTEVYQSTDMLILTSQHEGTPNVVLEAMSHGVPVVATKVGGVPEIVPEDCGFLVDPNDFEGLFRAASTLVLDHGLRNRMGRQAQEYVRKNHSIGYLQERLKTIYSGLMKRKQSSNERRAFSQ